MGLKLYIICNFPYVKIYFDVHLTGNLQSMPHDVPYFYSKRWQYQFWYARYSIYMPKSLPQIEKDVWQCLSRQKLHPNFFNFMFNDFKINQLCKIYILCGIKKMLIRLDLRTNLIDINARNLARFCQVYLK